MNKTISIVFLVVGIVLLVYGFNASNSFASNVSEAVTGTPTDRSMWLMILGVVGVVVGGIGLFAGRRQ
jgi:Mn2+/Fe2+ NRAMP family transporter